MHAKAWALKNAKNVIVDRYLLKIKSIPKVEAKNFRKYVGAISL